MGRFGTEAGEMDVLVLGCTHYPFAAGVLSRCIGPGIALLDAGDPVARRTKQLLSEAGLCQPESPARNRINCITTGNLAGLQEALARWLPSYMATTACIALDAT
jgi:glutamate racemase